MMVRISVQLDTSNRMKHRSLYAMERRQVAQARDIFSLLK